MKTKILADFQICIGVPLICQFRNAGRLEKELSFKHCQIEIFGITSTEVLQNEI